MLAAGRAAQVAIAFATLRFATSALSPYEFGLFALLTGFKTLFGLFLISPVGQHVNRHTHEWFAEHSLISHLKTYNRYIVMISVLAGLSLLAWMWVRDSLSAFALPNALIMAAVVLAGTWNATLIPMLNMLGKRAQAVYLELITAVLTLLSAIALCKLQNSGVMWFAGSIVGSLIGASLAWRLLIKMQSIASQTSKKPFLYTTTIRHYCLPLAVATGLMWFYTTSYRYVIEWYWGAETLGAFAFCYIFASQVWAVFETLMTQFIYPYFYRAIAHQAATAHDQAYNNLVNIVLPIYLFLLAMLVAGADVLMPLIANGPAYQSMINLLPLAFLFEFFRVVTALLSQGSQVEKTTHQNIPPYALGGVCVITGSVICAELNLNMQDVAIAMALSGTLMLISMYLKMRNHVSLRLEWQMLLTPVLVCLLAAMVKPVLNTVFSVTMSCLIAILLIVFLKFKILGNPQLKILLTDQL